MIPQATNHQYQNQTPTRETRTYSVGQFSVEQREEVKGKTIVGHAAVFNTIDGPEWFREQIAPGAFSESIEQDDVRALLNHDPNMLLGRNKAGTLRLKEDDAGLHMEIEVPDTTVGNDLIKSIERGDISQASFAFEAIDANWETVEGEEVRTIKKAKLYDVSPVTFPWYEATDIGLRQAEWQQKQINKERTAQPINICRKRILLQHRT
jgi:HK97 family phage prohead protease